MKTPNEKHFNGLTPAEAERLAHLSEECGEIVVAIGKILRHGYESKHPDEPTLGITNREQLAKEIGNATYAMEMVTTAGDVDSAWCHKGYDEKRAKIPQYMHHQTAVTAKT